MKLLRSSLRATVAACLAVAGIATSAGQTPPTRILPLGDSLTSGTTVVGAYRNGLYELLDGAGFNVDFVGTLTDENNPPLPDGDHQGMGGYRIAQLQAGLPWWLNQIETPDVVLLMVGTNDFSAGDNIASAPNRLAALVSDLATKLPHAKIIVATLPLRTDSAAIEAQQSAFNAAIPGIVADQVALGRQVSYADLHSALEPADLEEGVHPTAGGYQKLAETWFPAIGSVITPLGTADAPKVLRTGPATDLQHIDVTFSKPVADSAANLANFSVNGGLTITQATLDAATKRTVTLTTSVQAPGTLYTVSIGGVRDRTPEQNQIAAGSTAYYTSLTLTNGSFEDGENGWSMTGNRLVYENLAPYIASHGDRMLIMNGGQTAPNAYISQDFGTVPGQVYRLEYDAGVLALNTAQQRLGVQITGNATHLAEIQYLNGNAAGNTVWTAKSHVFTADSAITNLAFGDLSTTSNSIDLLLDHVRITAVPPLANSAPVAVADSYSITPDTVLPVPAPGVLANDSDFDTDPLTVVLDSAPSHGALVLNPDGGFTYTPAAGYTGGDSFTYHANDGALDSNTVTVAIEVAPLPVELLVNGSFENGETGWNMSGSYLVYQDDGTYTATEGTGLLVLNGGQGAPNALVSQSFSTVPGQSYTLSYDLGVVSFNNTEQRLGVQIDGATRLFAEAQSIFGNSSGQSLWVAKSHSFTADSSITTLAFGDLSASTAGIDLLLDNVRVTPDGAPSNTAPAADDDIYQVTAGMTLSVAAPGVLANDSDAEGDALTAIADSAPSHGSLSLAADGGFTYTPDAGFTGFDSFTYHADDGDLTSEPATVSIEVTEPNAAPVANADSYSIASGGVLAIAAPGVLANDSDADGDDLTAVPDSAPGHGTLDLNADGGFTYTPDSGYTGPDSFTYHVSDGETNSPSVVVTLSVFDPATELLVNGSFESDFDGWTAEGIREIGLYPPTDGKKEVIFNSGNRTPDATLSQVFATVPGQTYLLRFDIGVLSYVARNQRLGIDITGAGPLLSRDASIAGSGAGDVEWETRSYTFTADATTAALTFEDRSAETIGIDLMLDHVSITGQTTGGNEAPQAMRDTYATVAGTALVVSAPGVLANDHASQGGTLSAVLDVPPSHGTLGFQPDGSFTYQPDAGFAGVDSFSYHAVSNGLNSNNVIVTIAVDPADSGMLVNPSFESNFNGWATAGNTSVEYYQPTDGIKIADFNSRDRAPGGTISQSFATTPGTTYSLRFDAGLISYTNDSQVLGVVVTGGATLLEETITLQDLDGEIIRWSPQTFTFTADGGSATLEFRDLSTATVGIDLLVDNVRIAEAVTPDALAAAAVLPDIELGTPAFGTEGDDFSIALQAIQSGNYVLERSDNLKDWETVNSKYSDGLEEVRFLDPRPTEGEPRLFYRIRYQMR
ncbi:MAG: tandem-95 repeat protein [Akkermansiaceae bacterium]|nr:tandem-95 repeat protein [Akkermansiaceae bacterium]MCP5546495.1 tandem-95 repeat protein [Akkermansiaceae bacterium]